MNMKYIITEVQYDRLVNQYSLTWVRRRYDLVRESLIETYDLMKSSICSIIGIDLTEDMDMPPDVLDRCEG